MPSRSTLAATCISAALVPRSRKPADGSSHLGEVTAVLALAPGRNGTLYAAGTLGGGGFVARVNAQGERAGWLNLGSAARGIGLDAAGAVYVGGDGFLEKLDSTLNQIYTVPPESPAGPY